MVLRITDKATVLAEAQKLQDEGLGLAEIAKQLGVRFAWLRRNMPSSYRAEPLSAAKIKAYRASLPHDERDAGARILGDPPPGRSALDKRRG